MKHTCKYCGRAIIPLKNGNSLDAGADCLAKVSTLDMSDKMQLVSILNIHHLEKQIEGLQDLHDAKSQWDLGDLKEAKLYLTIQDSFMFQDIANNYAKKLFPKTSNFNGFSFMGSEDYCEFFNLIFKDAWTEAKVERNNQIFGKSVYIFTIRRNKKFNIIKGA